MAQILKWIDAGALKVITQYSKIRPSDSPKQRAEKQKASSAAQARMNKIYSYRNLEYQLALNFPTPGSGLVLTLTFDDGHIPKDRAQAQDRVKYFLGKLRTARARAGLPAPLMYWAIEILSAESGRWHVHAVLNSTGDDLEMIRRCWIYGTDIEAEKLRVDEEKNHETLARYMAKEQRECQEYESKPGLHGWSCTRNAKRPEIETVTVPDDYEISPPEGSTILLDEKKHTEWASYRVIKYRINPAAFSPAPKARRRKGRRLP